MENYLLLLLTISAGSERLTEYVKHTLPHDYNHKSVIIAINFLSCLTISVISFDSVVSTWPIQTDMSNQFIILATSLLATSGSSYINSLLELIKSLKGVK